MKSNKNRLCITLIGTYNLIPPTSHVLCPSKQHFSCQIVLSFLGWQALTPEAISGRCSSNNNICLHYIICNALMASLLYLKFNCEQIRCVGGICWRIYFLHSGKNFQNTYTFCEVKSGLEESTEQTGQRIILIPMQGMKLDLFINMLKIFPCHLDSRKNESKYRKMCTFFGTKIIYKKKVQVRNTMTVTLS